MTPTELRALDLEMAEKVMGWKKVSSNSALLEGQVRMCVTGVWRIRDGNGYRQWRPTESPADAMMVLKKVLLKRGVAINQLMNTYYINENAKPKGKLMAGPSLEIAICLFAREVGR